MPTPECYRDIGSLGARLDEMERARVEREQERDRARREHEKREEQAFQEVHDRLDKIDARLDGHDATRHQLDGVIWAIRIIFGAVGIALFYLIKEGIPDWFRQMMR